MNHSDHELLHDWVLRAVLAGSAFSVLRLLVLASGPGPLAAFLAGIQLCVVVAAVVPPRSVVDGAGLLLLGLIGSALGELRIHESLPLVALLFGIGLARGINQTRDRIIALSSGAAGALAGLVIERGLAASGWLEPALGSGLAALAAGACFGAAVGVGAIGRLLGDRPAAERPVGASLEALAGQIHGANQDVAALLRRAADAHRQGTEGIAAPAPMLRAADDLVRRMVRFAGEWLDIERRASSTRPESLTERIVLLESRLEKTTDPVTKAELERAIAAVRAQGEALTEILAGRERAVARLEHQVATLERLRFAALRHRSADSSRLAAELAPVLEELTDAGGEYDVASDALQEADRDQSLN
ncbi:MAG: hypothetical protein ABI321_07830 [Polyangia bacterium]